MPTLRFHTGEVFAETGASLATSETVSAAGIDVGPEHFEFVEPVAVDLSLANAGSLVIVSGRASVLARVECVRCLEPFEMRIESPIEAYLVQQGGQSDLPDDMDVQVVSSEMVDLWPIVESALAEQAPFAPLHSEDCRGICPSCGADLNKDDCSCPPEEIDSPFASLKTLFHEDNR